MGKIVCLMGKSSSGKDTVYKRLLENNELQLESIIQYTTRPVRAGEQDGVEYHFTDEEGYRKLEAQGNIIENKAYNTCHGLWRYFTVAGEEMDLDTRYYLLIGTLDTYRQICQAFGSGQVIPVMIELDDGVRLQRALDREKTQEQPKYEEMCRRFLADAEDFAKEKQEAAGIEQVFDNEDLEQCLIRIEDFLKGRL